MTPKSTPVNKSDLALEMLTTSFTEIPIIRVSRSFAELHALDLALDMSVSVLGAGFPEEFQDGL